MAIATTLGTFSTGGAFVVQPKIQTTDRKISFLKVGSIDGGDWDNDDFLESLGGETESKAQKSNDDDIDMVGATLAGAKEANDERAAGSGSERFAKMMEMSKQKNQEVPNEEVSESSPFSFDAISKSLLENEPTPPPPAQQPPAYPYAAYPPPVDPNDPNAPISPLAYPPNPYAPPPPADPNNPNAVQPPPPYPPYPYPYPPVDPNNPNAPPPPYPPPPYPPPPPDYQNPYAQYPQPPPVTTPQQPPPDGKKVGRNRDADTIANTADVYFAQLKLDTKIRKQAFMRGDKETFNKPFEDDRVNKLKEALQDNPHILAERRKSQEEEKQRMEAAEKQMDLMNERAQDFKRTVEDVNFTGQSYKQKLLERKNRKKGIQPASEPPAPAVMDEPPAPPVPEPIESPPQIIKPQPVAEVTTAPPPPPPAQSILSQTKAMSQESPPLPPPTPSQPQPKIPPLAPPTPPKLMPMDEIEAPIALPTLSMENEAEYIEESRRQIRTLMGLLIKHRGGPGFGAGRLKPEEGTRMVKVLNDITAMLQQESGLTIEDTIIETPPPPTSDAAPERISSATVMDVDAALDGSIQCIEGALGMYKAADPNAKSDLLNPLRAALMSAVDKLNDVIVDLETEVDATITSVPHAAPAPLSSDPSSEALLERAYASLDDAVGDGKYGLKNMSAQEADSLIESLSEVKGVLLDELDLGIPQATNTVPPPPPGTSSTPPLTNTSYEKKEAASKFQIMQAKVKAEEAKGGRLGLD